MVNFWKRDFETVSEALMYLTNGKIPKWGIIVWYYALLPLGLLIYPIAKIYQKIQLRKIDKFFRKWEENIGEGDD